MSKLQGLYTVARDTLGEMGIGVDILPWLVGEGRATFVDKLQALGAEFGKVQRIRPTSNRNVIWVNLDASPKLPFWGAKVVENSGGGWVKLEIKKAGLYVDGKKVILHLEEGQKNGKGMKGFKLKEALKGKPVLHPNILDALLEYPHFISEAPKSKNIFFWGVIYSDSSGGLCVRCLYWDGGRLDSRNGWLSSDWDFGAPAALCTS